MQQEESTTRRMLTALDLAALSLVTIGALNWGLSAINFNLVRRLFGRRSALERATYALVALAGVDVAWLTARYIAGGYQTPSISPGQVRRELGERAEQIGQGIQRGAREATRQARQIGERVEQTGERYQQPGMRP